MAFKPKGKASGAASAEMRTVEEELAELQMLMNKHKYDLDLQQGAWDAARKALYSKLPQQIGGQTYNLAPNAPLRIFQMPSGEILKVPAARVGQVPKEAVPLNKSEMEVFKMLPPKPGMTEAKPPLGAIGTSVVGAAAAPAIFSYGVNMGDPNKPSNPPSTTTTEPVAPQSTNYFVEKARDVLGGPYYGMDDSQPGDAYRGQYYRESGSPYVGSPMRSDEGSPFEGFTSMTEGSPYVGSPMQKAVTAARTAGDRAVSNTQTTAAPSAEPSALAAFIRGRFGDAAKGSPFDDRLTAAQEARDKMGEGRATGGSVDGKPPKDAALHKALEIIHHLISRG